MRKITYNDYLLYVRTIKELKCNEDEEIYQPSIEIESNNTTNNKHDKCFRDIFSDKNEIINFLKDFVNCRSTIKVEEIEAYNSSFITSKYQSREADIIYKIKGKNAFILIEHQSKIDKKMQFRLMEYYTEILRTTNIASAEKMPIVIPIIIYTGDKEWKTNGYISEHQEEVEGYQEGRLNVKYNLIQSRDFTTEELLKKGTMLANAMIIENSNEKILLIKNLEKIIENTKDKEKLNKLKSIIKLMLSEILEKEEIEKIEIRIDEKEENCMNALAERIKRNERRKEIRIARKAKEKGRSEGISQGISETIRSVAKKLINIKMPIKDIEEITGLTEEEIKNIQ